MEKTFRVTEKGFKVIDVNLIEIMKFGATCPICDYCNDPIMQGGVFIPVLGSRVYCNDCYNTWHKSAKNYPEDQPYEQRSLVRALHVLNNA